VSFDVTVPVVIAGAGAAGLSAALAARDAGADVLVLEQDAAPAGTTAMSQGNICAAGTAAQAAAGVEDSPDLLFADIMAKTRGLTDPVLARTVADHAGQTVDTMIQRWDMPWELDLKFKAGFGHSVRRIHSWLGRGGADMVQLFAARTEAAGADILTGARLVEIHSDGSGRAIGVRIARPDGSTEDIGCDALVLATCGFAASREMVAAHIPEAAHAMTHTHAGNDGTGIRLGAALGGALADMAAFQGYGMLTVGYGITTPPSVLIEGGYVVNLQGQRFCHELDDISGMVRHTLAQPEGLAFVIYDDRIADACGYIPEMAQFAELNAARTSPTLDGLAASIGVPADALVATHEAALAAAGGGADPFGRPWASGAPPSGPFRALKVTGALYHTQGGLQVGPDARVLRTDGARLPNLFAAGGAARGVSGPGAWGYLPAMGLGSAVTLGRLAGSAAAALTSASPRV
jgi:fumarate reductase flavoprotein subunit